MKNTILFSLIFMTLLGNGVFSKASAVEEPIDIYVDTRLDGTTSIGRDADVTVRTLDPETTPETQTQALNSGGAYFNFFCDSSGIDTIFENVNYDFKVKGGNLGFNIPNIKNVTHYNVAGQVDFKKNFSGLENVEVPKMNGFYSITDVNGESFVLRNFGNGFAKSKNWKKQIAITKDDKKETKDSKFTYNFEVKINPWDTSNIENATTDTISGVLGSGTHIFNKYDLKKIENAKRIQGTVRALEDLTGIENAKVVVKKLLANGTFKDLDSTMTDVLGEYTTSRISVNDSIYISIAKDGFMNTVVGGEDKGSYISRVIMTDRVQRNDTIQTGKYFQENIDFVLLSDLENHPLYDSAIAEQVAMGNDISELTNKMLAEGRKKNICQAWSKGNKLGIYLVPGEFTSAERDSMVLWLDEEARQTGYDAGFSFTVTPVGVDSHSTPNNDFHSTPIKRKKHSSQKSDSLNIKYELLSEVPTSPTASWLRVIKGDNEFASWQYSNMDSIAPGYDFDIINRGGDVKVSMGRNATLKELTSRVTQDNTVLIKSNSNAIPTHVTEADEIFRTKNLKFDKANFANGYMNGSKSELTEIMQPTP
ncbi:MAG: hypothetical protein PF638_05665 [Candidatus Delongbacteria bacterium]|jgi:hypothetical protein|nr:hypothetical protein [Candidatus Delongbacteria bacterium]